MTFDDWCAAHGAKELSMEDPFADLRGKRMSELTAEQTDRSNELWLREQIGPWEGYWYPHLQALFRVIDRLRAQQAKPVQPSAFDPVAAMRLADNYAFAQSELDGEHSTSRKYYVDSRDEARTALAAYLGIKEAK